MHYKLFIVFILLSGIPATGAELPHKTVSTSFPIPVYDLSQDTTRQSVVDKESGQYLGHPTTILMDDGVSILAAYPKGHGFGQIVLKRSLDGGRSWSKRLPVPASWTTGLEVPTLFKTADADGKKHLLLFSGCYPIRMSHSEDGGQTWSELEAIGDFGGSTAMSSMANPAPGKYVAFFHDEGAYLHQPVKRYSSRRILKATGVGADRRTRMFNSFTPDWGKTWYEPSPILIPVPERPGDIWEDVAVSYMAADTTQGGIFMTTSEDGGLTWSSPMLACPNPPNGMKLTEAGCISSPNGKEFALLMRENSRKFSSQIAFSHDGCKTWSAPRDLPKVLTGDRHCAKYLKDGRIFISFRDKCPDSPHNGDWVGWIGTYGDLKNGQTGDCRFLLMHSFEAGDCAYPGVEILPDGTIVTTTYGHWDKDDPRSAYVVSIRLIPGVDF